MGFKVDVPYLADDMIEGLVLIRSLLSNSKAKRLCTRSDTLTRVLQTDFTPGSGNALQAGVAAMMNLTLDAVPNFVTAPEGYEASMTAWLKSRGKRFLKVLLDKDGGLPPMSEELNPSALCLVRGTSPRGDHGHVVVGCIKENGKSIELLHDPHPDSTMLRPPLVWC